MISMNGVATFESRRSVDAAEGVDRCRGFPLGAEALRRLEGDRPSYDAVLMFYLLILRTLHTLSDGAIDAQFAGFDAHLKAQGILAIPGQIVDAAIVAAPRRRNSEDEKKAIKEGPITEEQRDRPKKLARKDRDARWTLKRAKAPATNQATARVKIAAPVFGYNNHISTRHAHGFAPRFAVTSAPRFSTK